MPIPNEMTPEDIEDAIEEFVQASINAIRAGFDGVELHGANGYLIKQFLNPHTNRRTDEYGGTIQNRSRFLLEITQRIIKAIGKDKVGVRVSPYAENNETYRYAEADDTYLYVARQLNILGIAYLHITDPDTKGAAHVLATKIRAEFENTIILSGGFDANTGLKALERNEGDLIAFGRPFIANPDLVERYNHKLPLNQLKFDLFFSPGKEGYVDYPVFEDVQVVG
jgi:N-ethylmaleimide reductase